MNISHIKINVTAKDLLGIINQYVNVDGLNINNIEINELITIYGTYKKGIKIPFKVKLGIGNIHGNLIFLKLININIGKIGILKSIQRSILKKLLEDFNKNGIAVDKDNIAVNLDEVIKAIPYFYLKLVNIELLNNVIAVDLADVAYEENKETIDLKESSSENNSNALITKYSKAREDMKDKVPDKYKDIMEYAMIFPDLVALIIKLLKDKRVPLKDKLLMGGVMAYLISPIDIVLDFIPFIGQIDDLAIVFFVLSIIINEIEEEIIVSNWDGKENVILLIREGVKYIVNILGEKNIKRIAAFFKISQKSKN